MTTRREESVLIDNVEVCRLLGVKAETWRQRVQKGLAPRPHSVMGARSYYRRADVEHFLAKGLWPARMTFSAECRRRRTPPSPE